MKTQIEERGASRSHEHELEIAAAPQIVWEAITEAAELVNWFPLEAVVESGEGGSITYRWGEDVVGVSRVLVWQPARHLRTSWMEPVLPPGLGDGADEPGPRQSVVDWHIEGRGGATVLRLVHSGFGRDARWDSEFDGTRRGWDFELRSLKHYLERHRGRTRRAFWLRQPVSRGPAEVWSRLARGPFARQALPDSLREGERYRLELSTGDVLEGRTLIHTPPTDFAGEVDGMGDALFRFGYEVCGGRPEAVVWLSSWASERTAFEATERRFRSALERAFAG